MKWLIVLTVFPGLILGPSGCAPITSVVRQEQHRAVINISSDPPGYPLQINNVVRGVTPTEVPLLYSVVEKEVIPGSRKQGWWLLGTGIIGLGAGIGLAYWGLSAIGNTDYSAENYDAGNTAGRITLGSLGLPMALYGLFGVIGGIYYLASSKTQRIVEISPPTFTVGIQVPTAGIQETRISSTGPLNVPPPWDRLKKLHYSSEAGWTAPGIPPSLQLQNSPNTRPLARRASAQLPTETLTAPSSNPGPGISPAELALVEKLRKQGADCYRQRIYDCALAKFERAYALVPSNAMRFNLASALDKLNRPAQAARQYQRYLQDSGAHTSPSALAHIQQRMRVLLPQVGRLHLLVRPAAARVTLDGVSLASLVATKSEGKIEVILQPATYQLEISQAGYQPWSLELNLTPGQLKLLEVVLQPTPFELVKDVQ